MICDRKDPAGWVPFCGHQVDAVWEHTLCPHPRRSTGDAPTPEQMFAAAWASGWRPPHIKISDRPNLLAVQSAVAGLLGRPVADLVRSVRAPEIDEARAIAMAACRRATDASYPELGRAFARDHTTVMHACQRVAANPSWAVAAQRIADQARTGAA